VQALAVTVAKNIPAVTRVVLLVGGESAETLAGHVDLAHPIAPDLARAVDEAPRPARPPVPTAAPTATPSPAPTKAPARKQPVRPRGETT
jgi:hypothetical protein